MRSRRIQDDGEWEAAIVDRAFGRIGCGTNFLLKMMVIYSTLEVQSPDLV